jgi:Flp pilus assembly protein TadD
MQMKNHEAALEPLKKCVELKPSNPYGLYNLAVVYLNLRDDFTARETYKKLVQVDPGLAEKLKKILR